MSHQEEVLNAGGKPVVFEQVALPAINSYCWNYTLVASATAKKYSIKKSLASFTPSQFDESGVLELEKTVVHYTATAKDQYINFGFCNIGSSVHTRTLGMTSGHSYMHTDFNRGPTVSVTTAPGLKLSRMMRGTVVTGMPAQFKLSASLGMVIIMEMHYKLHSIETRYEDLNC